MTWLRSILLLSLALCPAPVLAQRAPPGGGCNVHGCWPAGGGCNVHGCWRNGGGCNLHGCWNSPSGSCNIHGCSDWGECTIHGCPPPPPRRPRGAWGAPPAPPAAPPAWAPQPRPPAAPPADYAQEVDELPAQRRFAQGGLRFDYPADFSVEVSEKKSRIIVTLSGPRSLSAYVTRYLSDSRPPEVLRDEFASGLAQSMVDEGLQRRGTALISATFRGGQRGGIRHRLDNRDDVYVNDSFAWARPDGTVVLVHLSHKSRDGALAARYFPILTRSLE